MFSVGFSSGLAGGRCTRLMLDGKSSLRVVCQPALSSVSTAWPPAATHRLISSKWCCMAVAQAARARCRCRAPDRSRRINRRWRNADPWAGADASPLGPTDRPSRSSARPASHPGTRSRPRMLLYPCRRSPPPPARESFFKSLNGLRVLLGVLRTWADVGKAKFLKDNRQVGLCLLCHRGPFPDDKFQGTLAPDLAGAGNRW